MASILIRGIDENVKRRLKARAARHRRSMEAEAREILTSELARVAFASPSWAGQIRARFAEFGGLELPALPREAMREPPKFGK